MSAYRILSNVVQLMNGAMTQFLRIRSYIDLLLIQHLDKLAASKASYFLHDIVRYNVIQIVVGVAISPNQPVLHIFWATELNSDFSFVDIISNVGIVQLVVALDAMLFLPCRKSLDFFALNLPSL